MKSPTNNVLVGFRVLDPDPEAGRQLVARFRMYPYGARKNPAPVCFVPKDAPGARFPRAVSLFSNGSMKSCSANRSWSATG
jgi:hypothetical protein